MKEYQKQVNFKVNWIIKKFNNMLRKNFKLGIKALSIVLISFKFPKHELKIKSLAEKIGFKFISCSSEVSPMINYLKGLYYFSR